MFYIPTILGKRGPLAKLWLAAHDGRRLTRAQIMEVDVPGAVELFHQHDSLTSLRVQGDLLVGISYITKRQTEYLMEMANRAIRHINSLLPLANLEKEGGTASTSRQRPGLGAVTAGEQAALTALIHTVEPVFEEEDFQLRLDQVIPEDGDGVDDPNFTANVEVSAEELARRRRNVTMEEEELVVVPPPGDPATADHLDHTDNLGGPIDMDDSGVGGGGGGGGGGPARKGVVQPSDLLDGSFNLAGQSVSEINRLVNSATVREDGPQQGQRQGQQQQQQDQSYFDDNMQVDPTLDDPTLDQSRQDQDNRAPSIDRHPVNGEAARKRLRPAADINAAVPPGQAAEPAPPLVLEELTPRQIAAARRDGRQPGPRPARPRAGTGLVIPAVIDNRPGRHLVIDRVIRITDADFRAQLAQPRVHTAPVDFPVVEDGGRWREDLLEGEGGGGPSRPTASAALRALYRERIAVAGARRAAPAVVEGVEEEEEVGGHPDLDPIIQPNLPEDYDDLGGGGGGGGLGASMATLPRSPVVGIQYPPRSPPPPPADHAGFDDDDHGLNQQPPPPPMEENFSDRGDDRPTDTSTIGDARRSHRLHQQSSSSRMATADEHAQLESAIIAQATLNLTAMGATERLPFRQFVGKSAGAGGGVGRRVAAMTFLNLLARHDQQQAGGEGAFLEQEPSYERFNTLYVRRARE
mgnify:CR=1 FL=1